MFRKPANKFTTNVFDLALQGTPELLNMHDVFYAPVNKCTGITKTIRPILDPKQKSGKINS